MVKGRLRKDPLNLVSHRNAFNTPVEQYNCGGFAFNLFNWFCPYPAPQEEELFLSPWWESEEEEADIVNYYLEATVDFMLSFFADRIRIIKSVSELNKGEYAVAYKTGLDDFHFMKRCSNGVWYEKMGMNDIHTVDSKVVFNETWYHGSYTSRTVLFAFKFNIE